MGIRRARAVVAGTVLVASMLLGAALAPAGASTGQAGGGGGGFRPGAPGVGDDYFPLYGNGGYDVGHYLLKVSYDPATDRLVGVATISARATQNLSRFNLDLVGLTVRSIKVNGRSAGWSRTDHELTVTPRHGLRKGRKFTVVVRYDSMPSPSSSCSAPASPSRPGSSTPTTARSSPASPRWPRAGSRSTTTRSTRRPTPSWSPHRPPSRWSPTAACWLASATGPGAPGCGTRPSRWPPTWPRSTSASSTPAATGPTDRGVDVRRPRPRPVHRAGQARRPRLGHLRRDRRGLAGPPGRDPRLPGGAVRPVSVLDRRRHRRRLGGLGFALETQTRPSTPSSSSPARPAARRSWSTSCPPVVRQRLSLPGWKHIWLNEGFAPTPSGCGARRRAGAAQQQFDNFYNGIPADDPFWSLDRGPGSGAHLRDPHLLPGRHGPARPSAGGR